MCSNLPEHELQALPVARRRRRRRYWRFAATAGLAGVVGLAATVPIGPMAAPGQLGLERLANLDLLRPDEDADGATQPMDGPPVRAADPGATGRVPEGAGRLSGEGGPDPEHGGKDGGEKGTGDPVPAVEVACDPNSLIEAVTEVNTHGGGTLELAERCGYTLTAYQGGKGLPVITEAITITGNGAKIDRAANAAPFRIFTVGAGGNLTLRDLTVTGGRDESGWGGGGIWVQPSGTATLEHSSVTRNASDTAGGGILNAGTLTLRHTEVTGNTGETGGGIVSQGRLVVQDSRLAYNNAGVDGGGLYVHGGSALVSQSTVENNRVGRHGGGVFAVHPGAALLTHAKISDNTAVKDGGGVAVLKGGDVTLRHLSLDRNAAGRDGGGLYGLCAEVTVEESTITDNTAVARGAGVFGQDGAALLSHTEVTGNMAVGPAAQSGGIYSYQGSFALVKTRVAENNASAAPGGLLADRSRITVDADSAIFANRPTNCQGSSVVPESCFG